MSINERIIVCGGGPVGMVAALSLVRQGIPVTILEAFEEPPRDPRAATIHEGRDGLARQGVGAPAALHIGQDGPHVAIGQ